MRFVDRVDAGQQLAARLADLRGTPNLLVLGIPRGGVVVAYAVALALHAALDVALSRKLGAPHNEELAIGALAEDGSRTLDERLIDYLGVPRNYIDRVTQQAQHELERRAALYRGQRRPLAVRDRVALVVDDGVATGATICAALQSLRTQKAKSLIAAAPVMAGESIPRLEQLADRIVHVLAPGFFDSVGGFYENFNQVSDSEVRELLADLAEARSG